MFCCSSVTYEGDLGYSTLFGRVVNVSCPDERLVYGCSGILKLRGSFLVDRHIWEDCGNCSYRTVVCISLVVLNTFVLTFSGRQFYILILCLCLCKGDCSCRTCTYWRFSLWVQYRPIVSGIRWYLFAAMSCSFCAYSLRTWLWISPSVMGGYI